MEKQMRAEREKRAVVLASEGERDAKINQAEGDKQRVIKASEQQGNNPCMSDPFFKQFFGGQGGELLTTGPERVLRIRATG